MKIYDPNFWSAPWRVRQIFEIFVYTPRMSLLIDKRSGTDRRKPVYKSDMKFAGGHPRTAEAALNCPICNLDPLADPTDSAHAEYEEWQDSRLRMTPEVQAVLEKIEIDKLTRAHEDSLKVHVEIPMTEQEEQLYEEAMEEYSEAQSKEADPYGLAQHAPGAKLDNGKTRAGLMIEGFSNALEAVAEITTIGATKYTPRGWEKAENGEERYLDAACRHLLKHLQGEEKDVGTGGTGKLHLAQIAWNILAVLELHIRKTKGGN